MRRYAGAMGELEVRELWTYAGERLHAVLSVGVKAPSRYLDGLYMSAGMLWSAENPIKTGHSVRGWGGAAFELESCMLCRAQHSGAN